MLEKDLPIEWSITEIKQLITKYSNGLCKKYQVPAAILIQILQEIIYENQMNVMSQLISDLRRESIPTDKINIDPTTKESSTQEENDAESQSNDE